MRKNFTMTDIKIVISILCKHLNHLYNVSLKAENFRLAKYNKSEVQNVKTFWRLLSRMVDVNSENTVTYVKSYFLKVLKYKSLHFYSLPEDMSCGSRELLIALAYLIANEFLNNRIQDIINKSVFNPNKQSHSSPDTSSDSKEDSNIVVKQIKNNEDLENMMQWIDGQIEYNNRQCWEYQEAIKKLLLKVCIDTSFKLFLLSTCFIHLKNQCKFIEQS
ncbi:hypothetical protein PPYR_01544 [Photinus pyralis]|uniref:Tubulin epsilon and delta complex protein 1 domain-containing protein n=1 Tax=Photinus pyralis TaxID=7054 RepID=A0A5N4B4U3_PHOPY|nr:hypothetical protein PPYR_01544 [Photinus pyralis]